MTNLFQTIRIGVLGLGYVGLPLAVELAKKYKVTGFDLNPERVRKLRRGIDETLEVDIDELKAATGLTYSSSVDELNLCNFFIVTVPTPIHEDNTPDLSPLRRASKIVGGVLKKGDIVVFESTVYPGATEEVCVPAISEASQLEYNSDFFVGYSPERINPGDKQHRLPDIVKVTSGSTPETAEIVDRVYASIIRAGTFKASTIRVAEAAKVIENTQRDLNIALMNELSIIFNRLGIDTVEVLEAAGTKWNFLPFRPGLVGGHCIGIDPYYLTYKASLSGYDPEIILAGRRLNNHMPKYAANLFLKEAIRKKIPLESAKVLVMGATFKEDCPDIRNSKIFDLIKELKDFGLQVDVFDPWVSAEKTKAEASNIVETPERGTYDGIILAVGHKKIIDLGIENIKKYGKPKSVFFDLKSVFSPNESDIRL